MKTWSIARRIVVGYVALVAIACLASVVALLQFNPVRAKTKSMVEDSMAGALILAEIQTNGREAQTKLLSHILTEDQAKIASLEADFVNLEKTNQRLLNQYEATIFTDADRALFQADLTATKAFDQAVVEVLELSRNNKNREAYALFLEKVLPLTKNLDKAIGDHFTYNRSNADASSVAVSALLNVSEAVLIGGLALVILSSVGVGFIIIRGTNRVLRDVGDVMQQSSEQVASAASQVSSSSQTLAHGTSEQAASIEETSASLEEMSSMTKRNAESASQAKTLSNDTRQSADTGNRAMVEMNVAMNAIKRSSDDIAKIIKTIDEIAFQTNILALNAAVEAARAGEAGAGFAVVADEVRALAQRSAEAARESTGKIDEALRNTTTGVQLTERVSHALSDILEKASKVDVLVGEIAQASHEQSTGVNEVSKAVGQMDTVTQANAGNAEETAAAAEELSSQAIHMKDAVSRLQQLIGGKANTASHNSHDTPKSRKPAPGAEPAHA